MLKQQKHLLIFVSLFIFLIIQDDILEGFVTKTRGVLNKVHDIMSNYELDKPSLLNEVNECEARVSKLQGLRCEIKNSYSFGLKFYCPKPGLKGSNCKDPGIY